MFCCFQLQNIDIIFLRKGSWATWQYGLVSWGEAGFKAFPLLKWRFCIQQFNSDFTSSVNSIYETKSFITDNFMISWRCLAQYWRSAGRSAITVNFTQPVSWLNSPMEINIFLNRVWKWDTSCLSCPVGHLRSFLWNLFPHIGNFKFKMSLVLIKKPKPCRSCILSPSAVVIFSLTMA